MSNRDSVMLVLTREQVSQVVRTSGAANSPVARLSELVNRQLLDNALRRHDESLSSSLLRGLAVFSVFPCAGEELTLQQVATSLGFGVSVTHRYIATLVEAGLLQRDPVSRRYRQTPITVSELRVVR